MTEPTGAGPRPVLTVVLAAGKGTRMRSAQPKVLHLLGGRPLLGYALDLARAIPSQRTLVVLGHRADLVRGWAAPLFPEAEFVLQEPQLGTGHALAQCLSSISAFPGVVLVLSGDVPLLRTDAVRGLLRAHAEAGAAASLLTARLDEPFGYGRVLRDAGGRPTLIREQRDLRPGEESVREVNLGIYAFEAPFLARELPRLGRDNAQGEYYLTDLVEAARTQGATLAALLLEDHRQALGVNSLKELADMDREQRTRILRDLMDRGVRILDPETTYVEATVQVAPDATLHPTVFLHGSTRVEAGAVIHPGAVIRDSVIGPGAEVRPHSVVDGAVLGEGASAGPFAHLRPGTRLDRGARIGNFVEVKKSDIGEGSKVNHLTYVGDATLGRDVNIGAGCVTCNYDGFSKHRTVVGDGVFVGSGCMLVAPVRIGDRSLVAAGSTITKDVPADALAVARARQEERPGWAKGWREKKKAEKKGKETETKTETKTETES